MFDPASSVSPPQLLSVPHSFLRLFHSALADSGFTSVPAFWVKTSLDDSTSSHSCAYLHLLPSFVARALLLLSLTLTPCTPSPIPWFYLVNRLPSFSKESTRPPWVTSSFFPSISAFITLQAYSGIGHSSFLRGYPACPANIGRLRSVPRFVFRSSARYLAASALSVNYPLPPLHGVFGTFTL
jgi:hypothetical protein